MHASGVVSEGRKVLPQRQHRMFDITALNSLEICMLVNEELNLLHSKDES